MTTARMQTGFLFDVGDTPHEPGDSRTDAEREAHLSQILHELRRCEDGVTYLRLAEITQHWRDDLIELERRGRAFHFSEIDSRFGVVHLVN